MSSEGHNQGDPKLPAQHKEVSETRKSITPETSSVQEQDTMSSTTQTISVTFGQLKAAAVHYFQRYQSQGLQSDLDTASQLFQIAADHMPTTDPGRPCLLRSLAICRGHQYRITGNIDHLRIALTLYHDALELSPDLSPDRSLYLKGLAVTLTDLFYEERDIEFLNQAIDYGLQALVLMPDDHSERSGHLHSLAASFGARYQMLDNPQDLDAAFKYYEEAMHLTPVNNPARTQRLRGLAVSYTDRYRRFGNLQDNAKALELEQEALALTPDNHPDKARHLFELGGSYAEFHKARGEIEDLETALLLQNQAVQLTPSLHPDQARRLKGLALSYLKRFQVLGNSTDLNSALQTSEKAVELTPEGHPDRPSHLHTLAACFGTCYHRFGNENDLEKALQFYKTASDLTPEDDLNKADRLVGLANSYDDRFKMFGDLTDLELGLKRRQQALALTPDDHPRRLECLDGLSVVYISRYEKLMELKDLETALQYTQELISKIPEDHPNHIAALKGLAISYNHRYERLGNLQDLEASLEHNQKAVRLIQKDHPDRAGYLQSLAGAFGARYKLLGYQQDLYSAVEHDLEALRLTPNDHPSRAGRLQNIAVIYRELYRRLGDPRDLEVVLEHYHKALDLAPEHYPYRPVWMQGLAASYIDKYKLTKDPKDLEVLNNLYKASFVLTTSRPEESWKGALNWASFSAEYQPEYCVVAYKSAFALLPELLWIGHSISVRQEAIQRLGISQATATAAKTCLSHNKLSMAVEIIEQGVATMFQQMLQLKTKPKVISTEQALEFDRLSMALYSRAADDSMNIVNERNKLIDGIRKQPGNESFLLPKPYTVLREATKRGPIIILNAHALGCDAIIILNLSSDPVHVVFSNLTLLELVSMKQKLAKLCGHHLSRKPTSERLDGRRENFTTSKKEFPILLNQLWAFIVKPVYEALESHDINQGRLWWLPTGEFAGLPLHACAPTDKFDQFIHSYTATIGTLLESFSKESSALPKLGVVGIAQTNPRGENLLPCVNQEVENILSIIKAPYTVKNLSGSAATVDAVTQEIQQCSWLHLACHGKQDLHEPHKSYLLLYEGTLELGTILRMPLSNAQTVFLAACQTAMGDGQLVNESFHLSGGMIAAGFQAAIGTMWSIDDEDGPLVAKLYYSHLFQGSQPPKTADTAEALHFAVKSMRAMNIPYVRWVPFIHMGI